MSGKSYLVTESQIQKKKFIKNENDNEVVSKVFFWYAKYKASNRHVDRPKTCGIFCQSRQKYDIISLVLNIVYLCFWPPFKWQFVSLNKFRLNLTLCFSALSIFNFTRAKRYKLRMRQQIAILEPCEFFHKYQESNLLLKSLE